METNTKMQFFKAMAIISTRINHFGPNTKRWTTASYKTCGHQMIDLPSFREQPHFLCFEEHLF
jgi:hypothetical protein